MDTALRFPAGTVAGSLRAGMLMPAELVVDYFTVS